MAIFNFDIDAEDFLDALEFIEKALEKELIKAIKSGLWDIAKESGRVHRYTARSGNLDASYLVDKVRDLAYEVLLDKGVKNAPYAHAIHSGRPDWPNYVPDLFLFKAVDKKTPDFWRGIENAISEVIKKAGF